MGRDPLDTDGLERYESLFIAPHGDDVALGCPARVLGEVERGRRVLVMALFEPVGSDTPAARAVRALGADYAAAGLPSARERRAQDAPSSAMAERRPEDESVAFEAARLLTETGPRIQAVHVFAPLGLGASVDHRLTYEASVRAFATAAGRNLFL
jgi:LmbE family N-acetylglucosaminyl deacetylase